MLIVDSFAWIEFLGGTPLEEPVREALEDADAIVSPDIVLAEVAARLARDGLGRQAAAQRLRGIATLSQIVPISVEIAVGVQPASRDLVENARTWGLDRPGLADAIILSTGRVLAGKILTGDPHFRGLPETRWLGG